MAVLWLTAESKHTMKLTMRWFGSADTVKIEHIAQVPCIHGIVGTLEEMQAGEVWPLEKILAYKAQVEAVGLTLDVIESIPVGEAIKAGTGERDAMIEAYCESLLNVGRAGVKVVCYNFMPVFDWMRTEM